MLLGFVFDGRNQFSKERVGNIGSNDPDKIGSPSTETFRKQVGAIIQPLYCRVDPVAGRRRQFDMLVDISRNRRSRHASLASDIDYTCHFQLHISLK